MAWGCTSTCYVLFWIVVVLASDPKDPFMECVTCLPCHHRGDMGRLIRVTCCFPSFADIQGRRTECDFLDLGDAVGLSPTLGTRGGLCRM
jgi:hypothetical protein